MTDQIFSALGNDRPEILVKIEDCILETIISLSEGKSRETSMHDLYQRLLPLEKDLRTNDDAMQWFKMSASIPSTPQPSDPQSSELQSIPTPQSLDLQPSDLRPSDLQPSEFPPTPLPGASVSFQLNPFSNCLIRFLH